MNIRKHLTNPILGGGTLLLALGAATSGCATLVAPRAPAAGDTPTNHAQPTPSPTNRARPSPSPHHRGTDATTGNQEYEDDLNAAITSVNDFWTNHWSDTFTGTYTPPQIAGPYEGTSGPPCGDQPSQPNNAYYCPQGNFLAWDGNFVETEYRDIGDSFPYLVLAHEWGHAIQYQLDPSLVPAAIELQADCFAGAAIAGAIADGELVVESGDAEEFGKSFVLIGDDKPWTDPSSHGTAQQRVDAFITGVDGGVTACLPS